MRNRLVITLCAVVSLLAGAGLLTFWLVRSLAPAAALNYTPWPLSPEPYTQADLDEALALRTEGYEAQSVAAFDRALADWTNEAAFHAREERIRRLLCSYEEDDLPRPNLSSVPWPPPWGPAPPGTTAATAHRLPRPMQMLPPIPGPEDVFGDSYVVYEASASYTIRYQMPDESRLTVGERDRILTSYRDAVQAFLDGKTEDELSKEEAMTRALKRELKRLDQSLSTQWMALRPWRWRWTWGRRSRTPCPPPAAWRSGRKSWCGWTAHRTGWPSPAHGRRP